MTDWTPSALKAADCLANDLFPRTPAQNEAQTAIRCAVAREDLKATMNALHCARRHAPLQWRNWHDAWLHTVQRYILADLRHSKPEIA